VLKLFKLFVICFPVALIALSASEAVWPTSSARAEGLILIPPEARRGQPKPTAGPVDHRASTRARRASRQAPAVARKDPDVRDHLYDFIDHMLGHRQTSLKLPRQPAAARAAPKPNSRRPLVRSAAARPAQPAAPAPRLATPGSAPGTPAAAAPISTATIPRAEPTAAITTSPVLTTPIIAFAAEKAQAGFDLIKLELASRTYNEPKLPGDQVFETHPDWRVLERSMQAMEPAERAVATAAGFVANAYINDKTRTIVVAIAGSQDLRRHLITSDIWQALIKAESPQQFFLAKSYVRSVMQRYQAKDYTTECVGHSLGGGACAYVATELGLRAIVINPIAAGKLQPEARSFVTNYVIDGDLAQRVYAARGHEFAGDLLIISDGQDERRRRIVETYGPLSGPILLVRSVPDSLRAHRIDTALDQLSHFSETARAR
jgi:hypothetical protein